MRFDEWRFSAKLAWADRVARWTMIGTVLFYILFASFSLSHLIPAGLRSGVAVLHYNIYLGIDDVRSWPWLFLNPAVMLLILLVNAGVAFALYRSDPLAAKTLFAACAGIVALWAASSFFLTAVNA